MTEAKEGVLLELGFDDVAPNAPVDIGSWAYDHAASMGVAVIDNRAKGVACEAFEAHRKKRFPKADYEIPLSENQAFLLSDPEDFEALKKEYVGKRALYYRGQPDFEKVMAAIRDGVAGR